MVRSPRMPSASWRTTCSHRCTGPSKRRCARALCPSAYLLCTVALLVGVVRQQLVHRDDCWHLSQGRVVSGHTAALDVVQEAAVKKGALKAARLAVSGAFHTPLMQPARDALVKVQPLVSQPPCGKTRPYFMQMRQLTHQPDVIMQNMLLFPSTLLDGCAVGAGGRDIQHAAHSGVLKRHSGAAHVCHRHPCHAGAPAGGAGAGDRSAVS